MKAKLFILTIFICSYSMGFSQKKSAYLISPITATCKVISTKQSFAYETLYANHAQIPQVVNNKTMNTQPTETTADVEDIHEMALKVQNRYYMALLFKTRMIDTTKLEQIAKLFDYNHISKMAQQYTINDLKKHSKGHDKIFEQFAIQ